MHVLKEFDSLPWPQNLTFAIQKLQISWTTAAEKTGYAKSTLLRWKAGANPIGTRKKDVVDILRNELKSIFKQCQHCQDEAEIIGLCKDHWILWFCFWNHPTYSNDFGYVVEIGGTFGLSRQYCQNLIDWKGASYEPDEKASGISR